MTPVQFKPPPKTDLRYWISDAAIERYRQLAEPENRALPDGKLAELLDDRIHKALVAEKSTTVADVEDPGQETRIVEIEDRTGRKSVVVMRSYRPDMFPRAKTIGGPGGRAPLAVTVLPIDVASANFATGRWKAAPLKVTTNLGDKIVQAVPKRIPVTVPPTPHRRGAGPTSLGGSIVERADFIKGILRERPHIKFNGADGLNELVRAKFGTGTSLAFVDDVKQSMSREGALLTRVEAAVKARAEVSRGQLLADAIDRESRAKTAAAQARAAADEAETRAREAENAVLAAKAEVDRLLQAMRE